MIEEVVPAPTPQPTEAAGAATPTPEPTPAVQATEQSESYAGVDQSTPAPEDTSDPVVDEALGPPMPEPEGPPMPPPASPQVGEVGAQEGQAPYLQSPSAPANEPARWTPKFSPDSIEQMITDASSQRGIPPIFPLAVIKQESNFGRVRGRSSATTPTGDIPRPPAPAGATTGRFQWNEGVDRNVSAPVQKLISHLESIPGLPANMVIVSGLRGTPNNPNRGASRSQHLHGNALDVRTAGWTDEQRAIFVAEAIRAGARGIGIYPGGSIHIDTRQTPAIWGPRGYSGNTLGDFPRWAQPALRALQAGTGGQQVNTAVRNPNSTAAGLFQMIDSTAARYGYNPNASPQEQIASGMKLMEDNWNHAKRILGREPTLGEFYTLHMQGGPAGEAILRNPAGNFRETLDGIRPGWRSRETGETWGQVVLRQNPYLRSINTNDDFIRWSQVKMDQKVTELGGGGSGTRAPASFPAGQGAGAIQSSDIRPTTPIDNQMEAERARQLASQQAQAWSSGRLAEEAMRREWAMGWLDDEGKKFISDPNFQMTNDLRQRWTRDLPQEYHSYTMRARSEAHGNWLYEQAKAEQEYRKQIALRGVPGTAISMGMAILDPAGWALTAATGPFIGGASRLRRIGTLAAEGAGLSVAMELPQYMNRPGSDLDDLVTVGIMGAAFGTAIGAIGKPATPSDLAQQTARLARDHEASQFVGSGSMGAASTNMRQALREDSEDFMAAGEEIRRPGMGPLRQMMGLLNMEDFSSALGRSQNEAVALASNQLVQDAVGAANRNMTTQFSVEERARMVQTAVEYRLGESLRDNYLKWADDQGLNMVQKQSPSRQYEFNEQVANYVRDPSPMSNHHPSVSAYGETLRHEYRAFAEILNDPGKLVGQPGKFRPVRGFEDISGFENTYMPRLMHELKLNHWTARIGDDQLERAIAGAIDDALPQVDIGGQLSRRIAKSWLKSHREAKAGMELELAGLIDGKNLEGLMYLLRKEGVDEEQINAIRAAMWQRDKDSDVGATSRGKFRTLMNENYTTKVYVDGEGYVDFSPSMLFDNDATKVARMYTRQMSAWASLATLRIENPKFKAGNTEAQRYLVDGITKQQDWDNFLDQVRGVYDEKVGSIPKDVKDREMKQLQRVFDLITGKPFDIEAGNWGFTIRALQKFNFARVMNQVGFAQIAEMGNILGQAGFRATMEGMPMYRRMVQDMTTGQMDAKLAREIVTMTSAGTDWVRGFANSADEWGSASNITGRSALARNTESFLDQAGRFTQAASLMAPINYQLQRLAAGAAVARFADMAGGAQANMNRLRVLGLSDKDAEAIFEQIRKNAGRTRGDDEAISAKTINSLNLEKWDPELKSKFQDALWRWTRMMIQENSIGQMSMVTSHPIGRLFFQFRSFMLAAYTKQTLHSIHMRDWAAFSSFTLSMMFGALAYSAQTYLQSIGRPDQQEFLREKLGDDDKGSSEKKLAAAAFQRAGAASLMPMAFDQVLWLGGHDPLFAARSSGLPSQGMLSNPTASLVDSALLTARNLFTSEFSQADLRRAAGLSVGGNFLPFMWTYNSFGGAMGLPLKDEPQR